MTPGMIKLVSLKAVLKEYGELLYWNIKMYFSAMKILEERHLERVIKNRIYFNVLKNIPVKNGEKLPGVLKAKLQK